MNKIKVRMTIHCVFFFFINLNVAINGLTELEQFILKEINNNSKAARDGFFV